MVDIEQVTQDDRDAGAKFFRDAWHLFWPNDFAKAMEQAKEMQDGYCDNWLLVQSFAKHRLVAQSEAATTIERYREALVDDPKNICAGIPDAAIWAGINAWGQAMKSYISGQSKDWDEGMIVAAIFKAVARSILSHAPEGQPGDGK